VYAATRHLLPPGYDVACRRVQLGAREVSIYQAADPNAVADAVDLDAFAEDERFPYWAELWPSALALATFVLRNGASRGREAVELGCGLGLVGVAAALSGARVLFTDFEPDALAFARANHALNLGPPGRTRLVDWRDPPADLRAELVLASDVLYERRFLGPLIDTVRRTLAPGGTAYVAEPGRDVAEGTLEGFEAAGFERDLHLEEVNVSGRVHAVWIHEVRSPPDSPILVT
jgi:predicted nicotinamide N-methyase